VDATCVNGSDGFRDYLMTVVGHRFLHEVYTDFRGNPVFTFGYGGMHHMALLKTLHFQLKGSGEAHIGDLSDGRQHLVPPVALLLLPGALLATHYSAWSFVCAPPTLQAPRPTALARSAALVDVQEKWNELDLVAEDVFFM
jgi:hypothetical protein